MDGYLVARRSRIVHDDPSCRVCAQTEPGMVRLGADTPEPFRNPESGEDRDRDFAPEPEGGPHGVHWYHGTKAQFHGPLREPARDTKGNSRAAEDWNTELGVHFSSLHRVAQESFADNNGGSPHSRVAHATLHMTNPKRFANEDDLTTHAVGWAHGAGHRFLPEDPQAHKAFYHHNMDMVERADKGGRSYGHIQEHMSENTREKISDLDRHGPANAHTSGKRSWMNHHPERHQLIHAYRDHLRDQGHDGILYGNDFEAPIGHTSAIAFPSTPVKIDRWEHTHKSHPEYGKTGAQQGSHCPCGLPMEFDPQDGWQHADGSVSHDGELSRYSVSELVDLGRLPKRPDGTTRTGSALYDSPSRWRFKQHEWDTRDQHNIEHTKPFGEYTLHAEPKYDDGDRQLHVTAQDGQHVGEAYTGEHPTHPGHIELAPEVHPDHRRKGIGTALYNYAEELAGRPAAPADSHTDEAESFWQDRQRKHGRYTAPKQRLFGPTFGLDSRLFDGEQLRPTVRVDVVTRFDEFCRRHGYEGWHRWAKIVFFGSEASGWTSKTMVGNGDFDLSIGIHYQALRATVPGFAGVADEVIAAGFTEQMHAELNDSAHAFPGVPGVFDQTWFANLQGWDIARIRPYAAYDVVAGEWIVKPPELPDWSMKDFPEGPGMAEAVRGIIELAEGYLGMPEPYRTQNGAALWEFVHGNRSDAFGPFGEGWYDVRNVIEKALDQKGLMQRLWECHDRAQKDPSSLLAPVDWSNAPTPAR